jgi:hypothetical protein
LLQRKYGTSGSTKEAFKTLGVTHIPFHEYTDGKTHDRVSFFGGGMVSNGSRLNLVIAGVSGKVYISLFLAGLCSSLFFSLF